jgi:hypothetical protein
MNNVVLASILLEHLGRISSEGRNVEREPNPGCGYSCRRDLVNRRAGRELRAAVRTVEVKVHVVTSREQISSEFDLLTRKASSEVEMRVDECNPHSAYGLGFPHHCEYRDHSKGCMPSNLNVLLIGSSSIVGLSTEAPSRSAAGNVGTSMLVSAATTTPPSDALRGGPDVRDQKVEHRSCDEVVAPGRLHALRSEQRAVEPRRSGTETSTDDTRCGKYGAPPGRKRGARSTILCIAVGVGVLDSPDLGEKRSSIRTRWMPDDSWFRERHPRTVPSTCMRKRNVSSVYERLIKASDFLEERSANKRIRGQDPAATNIALLVEKCFHVDEPRDARSTFNTESN